MRGEERGGEWYGVRKGRKERKNEGREGSKEGTPLLVHVTFPP